jgi:ankyrin repeat protein
MSARLAETKDAISRFHVSMTPAHTIVAQACLVVLLHLDENTTKDRLKDLPLAEYAAEHWVDHARFENVSSKVLGGMKRLFDPSKHHLSIWVWMYNPELPPWPPSERSGRPAKAEATPLHYAAFYGMCDIATFLIVDHSQDVNAPGLYNEETPLHVSSRRGHVEIARVLLKHGAETEARDKYGFSPLARAAQEGHVELALVLLEHGADATAHRMRHTPLCMASGWGNTTVVQILLSHGADVKAQCENHQNPLHQVQDKDIARLLVEHGADANALDINNRTPLHHVSENGGVGSTRVLLEYGVDANAHDANNATPLHLASDSEYGGEGRLDVVRLLLQYGSDIHARDDEGRTPFMRATAKGYDDLMELLLEHGAEDHRA